MLFALRKRFSHLMGNEQGSVIMLVGLMAFLLILAVGVAVDMARAQILQQRISASLDAAGLAAMENISNAPAGTPVNTWVTQEAQRYFNGNFPVGYLGSTNINVILQNISADQNTITLKANTTQTTTFMQTFGVNTMSVGAVSTVTRSNNGTVIELVIVADNTLSMACDVDDSSNCSSGPNSKIVALKSAANQLVQTLYGNNATVANQYTGVVPFSQAVNVLGATVQQTNWMNPADPHNNTNDFPTTHGAQGPWQGCVTAGPAPYNITDDSPTTRAFDRYWYAPPNVTYNDAAGDQDIINAWRTTNPGPTYTYNFNTIPTPYNVPNGPNLFCPQVVTPMTSEKATITDAINSMTANGDTVIDQGLAWGWRMLSPNWRGAWKSADMTNNNLPLDYNSTGSRKIIILITDGSNHFVPGEYTAYGFLSDGQLGSPQQDPLNDTQLNAAAQKVDDNVNTICTNLGNDHVTVYTIGFGTDSPEYPLQQTDRNAGVLNGTLLQSCANATGGIYFPAPSNAKLATAFSQIANAIENIRVSK